MSQIFYRMFLNKTKLDHLVQVGDGQDPYFEDIPEEDLHFYQRKGAKRKRRLPAILPPKDLKILNSIKGRAYALDLQLSLCGFRLGWAAIIGLIPWVGTFLCAWLALRLVRKAEKVENGLPASLKLKMLANVTFDFAIGLIPIVGDFINIMYRCNSRNFILLEKHLVEKYTKENPPKVEDRPKVQDPPKRYRLPVRAEDQKPYVPEQERQPAALPGSLPSDIPTSLPTS